MHSSSQKHFIQYFNNTLVRWRSHSNPHTVTTHCPSLVFNCILSECAWFAIQNWWIPLSSIRSRLWCCGTHWDLARSQSSHRSPIWRHVPCFLHCDRSATNSSHSRGGGVLIAFSSILSSHELPVLQPTFESICIYIQLFTYPVYISAAYLPPNHSSDESKINALLYGVNCICSALNPNDRFVLVGDFNQSAILRSPAQSNHETPFMFFDPHSRSTRRAHFVDGLHLNALYSSRRILDLIYVNCVGATTSSPIRVSDLPLLPIDCYHPPLEFDLDISTPVVKFAIINFVTNVSNWKFARCAISLN